MIPGNATLLNLPIEFVEQPSKTYKMNLYTGERVQGYTDGQ